MAVTPSVAWRGRPIIENRLIADTLWLPACKNRRQRAIDFFESIECQEGASFVSIDFLKINEFWVRYPNDALFDPFFTHRGVLRSWRDPGGSEQKKKIFHMNGFSPDAGQRLATALFTT